MYNAKTYNEVKGFKRYSSYVDYHTLEEAICDVLDFEWLGGQGGLASADALTKDGLTVQIKCFCDGNKPSIDPKFVNGCKKPATAMKRYFKNFDIVVFYMANKKLNGFDAEQVYVMTSAEAIEYCKNACIFGETSNRNGCQVNVRLKKLPIKRAMNIKTW